MSEFDLKAYTTRAKELEAAIYTQKNLMSSHQKVINDKRPVSPEMKTIVAPQKPKLKEVDRADIVSYIIFIALPFLVAIVGFALSNMFWGVVGTLVGVFFTIGFLGIASDNKKAEKENKKLEEDYEKELEKYKKDYADSDAVYRKELDKYNIAIADHKQYHCETMGKHNTALSSLETALEELYSENVIFPKYRNLVAITTINEYLLSGRCEQLEGPDGAYNLYEMELRQNIVISKLSSIVNNLEQIKGNQFFLYQEIQKSNSTINAILTETHQINENSKLMAYFAGVTALAEISPKHYRLNITT